MPHEQARPSFNAVEDKKKKMPTHKIIYSISLEAAVCPRT